MLTRRATLAAVTLMVGLLAGCGGSPTATPVAATSAVPTATATTQAALTVAEAGKLYLAALGPRNKASFALNDLLAEEPVSLAKARKAATSLATADRAALRGLTTAAWPAAVAGDIDTVAVAMGRELTWARSLASAATVSDLADIGEDPATDNGAAQKIRAALDLPEAPQG